MSKPNIVKTIILFAAITSFSAARPLLADYDDSQNTVASAIPGPDRIKADMTSRFLYVHEGLPTIRDLTSSPSVHDVIVNSSVREGDVLKLNVTLILIDQDSRPERSYMAKSSMTYWNTDGGWELQTVEQNSIRDVGLFSQNSEGDC